MPSGIPKPPYEPEFAAYLETLTGPADITPEMIQPLRDAGYAIIPLADVLEGEPYTHEERTVPGPHGPVTLSIFQPKGTTARSSARPAIYYTHSGGTILGNRFFGFKEVLQRGQEVGAVCITVEHRLSPEHPFPVPLDDSYAGLAWVWDHVAELGIDPEYLMLWGQSAGGCLAVGMSTLARDRKGPRIRAQLLDSPMLDDRMTSTSSRQFVGEGSWSLGSNQTAWTSYLGASVVGKPDVSPLASPARATNVAGLPPTFIGVGSAELFREESIEYAQKLWTAGVAAELHIWPGGFHLFDLLVPDHPVSKASIAARGAWTKKYLTKSRDMKL